MDYKQKYAQWLEDDYFDAETKKELQSISGDDKEIKERFYKDLEFGTAGLRGIIGAGTNRMNIYTVGKATQGLANYIVSQGEETVKKGVAIAYDSRNMSPEFAETTALIMAANGIPVHIYPSLRPVPMLSFAVRHLGCTAGVVITASHNPPEYNGYKVYWSDGGQVPAPRDGEIITEVNNVTDYKDIKKISLEEAKSKKLYNVIDSSVDDAFIENIKAQALNSDLVKQLGDDFKVVYTPIHGSGNVPVRRALEEAGFKNVYVVKEQEQPDGNFPTVGYPNPENPDVFTLAIKLAKEKNADIIVGTDPDADRVGAVVKDDKGDYIVLTGNMTGALLTEYILSQRKAQGKLPANGAVIKTIVSTEIIRPICKEYGVKLFDVLTGFKYIGEKIKEFEQSNEYQYVFGFEESYGSLPGTYARDKDAVAATFLICEMAAYYKSKGMTLYDGLLAMYQKYGFSKEGIKSLTLKGIEGLEKIQKIMATFRENTPSEFAGIAVTWARDYKTKVFKNIKTGETEEDTLPVSDVLHYTLEDGTWICVRPSGTEPKLKFYYGVTGTSIADADAKIKALDEAVDKKLAEI
ncbi:phospho-sugar mutase [Clostridium sp. MD294]|uniref:phospho-sugar mutase n=1 Tax=Clostridium sp. MD294 TaxID=97138 RepID=UPI0002CB2DAC|nr:phospho-sugar mutase [Clostridium sp. MD294]NDO46583.1 phospho-sugar mutase [Clostridium sp. MD294]USF28986.1 Phosphoglucomutase [Clostridium sp. MD294]